MNSTMMRLVAAAGFAMLATAPAIADTPGRHPAYLHALSDLRDARAHLEHQSSDAVDHKEEGAIHQIDAALDDIKHAAIMDGKDIHDHAPVDAHLLRRDRFRKAMELLDKAEHDVSSEEDQADTKGLQKRVIEHINAARHEVHEAIEVAFNH